MQNVVNKTFCKIKAMRGLILAAITYSILQQVSIAQSVGEVSIDRRAIVHGAKVKSAYLRKDPNTRKINGVEIEVMTTNEVNGSLDHFYWRVRYYDRNGKEIKDTSIVQYAPREEEKELSRLIIDSDSKDTFIVYSPEAFDPIEMEKREKERKAVRTFYGFLGYWPPKATRVKVGLNQANFGWVTYHAPGM